MKCAACKGDFNDGVQCSSCKKNLDFSCAGVSEGGWRKLGAERRKVWKFSSCKLLSPCPPSQSASPEPASLDLILREVREMKIQLQSLPILASDVKAIKAEIMPIKNDITDLRASNDFLSNKEEDHTAKLTGLEGKVLDLESVQSSVDVLRAEVKSMKLELSIADQRSRQNNVEIKGIPTKKEEDLFTIIEAVSRKIGFTFPKSQVNYVYRIPLYNSKEKAIVVSFLNRYVKKEFMAAARTTKGLTAVDVGFKDATNRVFVNDHLNASQGTFNKN